MTTKNLLLAIVVMLLPLVVVAETVEINGVYYILDNGNGSATVTANPNKYSGDIVIPGFVTYHGTRFTVTAIEGGVFVMDMEDEHGNIYGVNDYLNGAFYKCSGLTSISIPNTIKTIGHSAFLGCGNLSAVYISDIKSWMDIDFQGESEDFRYWVNPLFYAHNLYLNGSKLHHLVLPDDVTAVKRFTFVGGNFLSVTFHKNIRSLDRASFFCNKQLKDVYSYSPGIVLYDNAFDKDIKNICLHIRERYKENYQNEQYNYIMYGWKDFGRVSYIDGVDYKLYYILDGNPYYDSFYEVGESIKPEPMPSKEGYTFSGWSDIPETMPDHDVTVTGTFSINNYKLTYFVNGDTYKAYSMEFGTVITPEAAPTKEGHTFSGWSEIPASMPAKDVNVYGTFSVNKYELIFLVDDVEYASYIIDYGSATIIPENNPQKENYEFISWSDIPATMPARDITSTASFKKVSTDIDCVKYKFVGDEAYVIGNNTSGIVKVLSSFVEDGNTYTVTVIDKNAFRNNTNITSVEVPNSIVAINDSAFFGCRNLTNIDLGKGVCVIGERAFANFDKLTDVVCYAEEVPDADRTSFENSYIDYVTLHVPTGSVEKYKAIGPWKGFKEIVPIDGPTKIANIHSVESQKASYNLNGIKITKANKATKGIVIRDGNKYYIR